MSSLGAKGALIATWYLCRRETVFGWERGHYRGGNDASDQLNRHSRRQKKGTAASQVVGTILSNDGLVWRLWGESEAEGAQIP